METPEDAFKYLKNFLTTTYLTKKKRITTGPRRGVSPEGT
jgi:hypothetical protein